MKVLIITYYWVPAGGSGVQRWLKFVKYLRDFGIEPVVFTVDKANYPIIDDSLKKDVPENITVLRNPIFEPNSVLSIFNKKQQNASAGFLNPNPSVFGKILQYIRANYFIPDARKFWINPSVKYLKKYLAENTIDTIITTGPPHSLHLIGLQLKKALGINWVADFRDPWTNIDYFHQLPLINKSIKKHHELEQEVVKNADDVLVIGKNMQEFYLPFNSNVHVVTNGFDSEETKTSTVVLDEKFSITHIGMMNADRNPKILWEVLSEISNENEEFKNNLEIKFIGKIAGSIKEDLIKYQFENYVEIDYVPHSQVKEYQQKSQILLLAVNNVPSAKGIITGKIFEYLQANRPILAIGPEDGDLAEILNQTKAGKIVGFTNKESLKLIILEFYEKYMANELVVKSENIARYHRKKLTEQLSSILKKSNKKI